jgi:hypothetical protein
VPSWSTQCRTPQDQHADRGRPPAGRQFCG